MCRADGTIAGALASGVTPLMVIDPSQAQDLEQLSEDDALAKSLDYKHEVSDVGHSSYKVSDLRELRALKDRCGGRRLVRLGHLPR